MRSYLAEVSAHNPIVVMIVSRDCHDVIDITTFFDKNSGYANANLYVLGTWILKHCNTNSTVRTKFFVLLAL